MRNPIIVDEKGNIDLFKTKQDAEEYLEPIDVHNQEYIAYDSQGMLLRLGVRSETRRFFFNILSDTFEVVCISETGVDRSQELRKKLKRFLCQVGMIDSNFKEEELLSYVSLLIDYFGKNIISSK